MDVRTVYNVTCLSNRVTQVKLSAIVHIAELNTFVALSIQYLHIVQLYIILIQLTQKI